MNHELILASQSPRRKQLLSDAGYEFTVDAPDDSIERGICSKCSPEELVIESAFLKATAIASRHQSGIVLAADTVAVCGSETLGKPTNRDHAERMLRLMSGKKHRVLTGVCLRKAGTSVFKTWMEETALVMDVMSDEELDSYLDTDQWIGKAGAFGYQDGIDWVHIEQGLASNVVGLPVERLSEWLESLDAIQS
jgi:septum formation protein